jgi:hypothetical protein
MRVLRHGRRDVLGAEDAAWLHMEETTNPMVVNAVLQLAEPLPFARALSLFERLASIPRFRASVVESPLPGRPSWRPAPSFDVTEHVERIGLGSGDDAKLRAFIGAAVSGGLDMRRPLWRAYLIDRPGAGTTILFRAHHSIADGFALLGVLLSLCDDAGVASRAQPAPAPRPARRRMVFDAATALWRLVALPADPRTVLKGSLGLQKKVAWSEPLPLADVKATAHLVGATVNDVLVATAAGALGRYLARRGESTSGLEVRAMVPVNLRASVPAATTLGNRFGLVVLGLPVGIADPVARVAAVRQRMELLKATPEAPVTHALLRAMGSAPRLVEDLAVSFFATKTSLVLTNVPGPPAQLSLAGVPVSRIMFWVPQSGRMGLGVSILSYAGDVTIGVLSDAALVPDPDVLVADLHAEYAELERAARSPASTDRVSRERAGPARSPASERGRVRRRS